MSNNTKEKTNKGARAAQGASKLPDAANLPMPWEEKDSEAYDNYIDKCYDEQDKNTLDINRLNMQRERAMFENFKRDFFALDENFRMYILHCIKWFDTFDKSKEPADGHNYNHYLEMLEGLQHTRVLMYTPQQIHRCICKLYDIDVYKINTDFNNQF